MPPRKKDKQGKPILTPREQRFVEGVARGKSATRAAKDAGYSKKTARQIAAENLSKPVVAAAYQERISAVKARTDEVLSLFALHLRGDFGDFDEACWNDDGTVNFTEAKRRGLSRLIKKVRRKTRYAKNADGEFEKIVETEVELYDAQAAGRALADIAGLKQQPRENEADRRDKRQFYEALIERILQRAQEAGEPIDRESAIQRVLERDAAAAQYLM